MLQIFQYSDWLSNGFEISLQVCWHFSQEMWSLNSNSPWSQAGLNDFFKGIECSGHDTMRLITRSQKKQYTIYLVFPLSLVHASLDLWAVMCVCACVCVCGQLCLTLCDPMDCSPQGSSVHGISQARILEWVAISFSRGSSWPSLLHLLHWQTDSLPLFHPGSPEPSYTKSSYPEGTMLKRLHRKTTKG